MTAAHLVSDLLRRGVVLAVDGERIRYRALKEDVTEADIAALRDHKAEILRLLEGPACAPADELSRAWAAAYRQTQAGFAEHGTEPSEATLHGATKLLLDLEQGEVARGIDPDLARELLEELHAGRSAARIAAEGRIVLWSVPGSDPPSDDDEGSPTTRDSTCGTAATLLGPRSDSPPPGTPAWNPSETRDETQRTTP